MSGRGRERSSPQAADAQPAHTPQWQEPRLQDVEYTRLLRFRTELRGFLHWSEAAAGRAGLTPSLHQLLLVVRGHPGRQGPTVGEVAEALRVRHHSAVELAQRAEAAGLLVRGRDAEDHRRMRLTLTPLGRERLEALTREHLPRIATLAATLDAVLAGAAGAGEPPSRTGTRPGGR